MDTHYIMDIASTSRVYLCNPCMGTPLGNFMTYPTTDPDPLHGCGYSIAGMGTDYTPNTHGQRADDNNEDNGQSWPRG